MNHTKGPFSQNVIFFDTEFSDLNARVGELLSIGLVAPNGETLYIELEYSGSVHPWVTEHVLPFLNGLKVSKATAREQINSFIQKHFPHEKPYLMAYVNQFDSIFWYDLFESPTEHPVFWIPIDFAAILFGNGFDPSSMGKDDFFELLGIKKDSFRSHNALDDALLLRETYTRFFKFLAVEAGE